MWNIELNVTERRAVWHRTGGKIMWQVRRKVLINLFHVIVVDIECKTKHEEEKRFIEESV
jgi:hypothetical protein